MFDTRINPHEENMVINIKKRISSFETYDDIPSKPLTLDLMETLNLFFRKASYHRNASYRKMKRTKGVEKL
jgi:hypothetical protein